MQRRNAASTCKLTKLQMNANLCLIIKILVPSTEDDDSNADGFKTLLGIPTLYTR
jgi:hypothetical protein